MKKSWERQSGRKRKDRSLTTEENTIKDAGDNFGRVTQKKKKVLAHVLYIRRNRLRGKSYRKGRISVGMRLKEAEIRYGKQERYGRKERILSERQKKS